MTTDTDTDTAAAAAATEDAPTATLFPVQGRLGVPSPLVAAARPDVVPYLARWTGEPDLPMPVVRRRKGVGIGYADEQRYDRDEYQVLWSRVLSRPGRGRPQFGQVHSARQRQCMTAVRCHICGGPADRTEAGVLWIIDARPEDLNPVRELTVHPPVCRPCAHLSLAACPHLQRAATVVRVRQFTLHGVAGVLYTPGPGKPVPMDHGTFPFTHFCAPYVRAYQLVMRLTGCTPIASTTPPPEPDDTRADRDIRRLARQGLPVRSGPDDSCSGVVVLFTPRGTSGPSRLPCTPGRATGRAPVHAPWKASR